MSSQSAFAPIFWRLEPHDTLEAVSPILLAGSAIFLSGYGVYAFFLGGIDGLPMLPVQYLPGNGPVLEVADSGSEIDAKFCLGECSKHT